ncbi:hypothetical protein GCM10008090_19790 [Arenicella chitinivorans]|uniref:Secreted protein n=1 Tax=Arenicella chitinivorans TaxID=1329800 RepID=A0A918VL34_9GAMM|nr:hypothetical protein [Arenicella chitinivorans]GHA10270.1 hypothetical protein GCM10008090_19790 [Arenicella chitinivorans]
MVSKNPVLPNFTRALLVISAALFCLNSQAGHHEKGEKLAEEKIVELKEMTKESSSHLQDQVDGELTDIDAAAAEDALADDIDTATKEITDEAKPLIPED